MAIIRTQTLVPPAGGQPPRPPQPPQVNWGKVALVGLFGWAIWEAFKSERHSNRTRHGYEREEASARYLNRRGADVGISSGSRGPIDVLAEWDDGSAWAIQMKSSRDGRPRPPGPSERARLRNASRRTRATPVIALSSGGRTTYHHATTGERLTPPRRR